MKKIITLMLSLALAIGMIGCSSNSIATVNNEKLPFDYFKTNVNWAKLSYENYGYTSSVWETEVEDATASGSSDSSAKTTYWDQFKAQMLEGMEQSEVVYQKAKEVDALPTDEEVQKAVDNFNSYLDQDESIKKSAQEAGINDEFLKYTLTRQLAVTSYQNYFNEHTDIEESKIKEEYENNKDLYDKVTASHILISTKDEDGNELSDAKKKAAKKKAEEVLEKIKDGEDFAKLAEKYSDDTANASNGGELGSFIYGEMVEEFSDAAFALKKGEVSGIVKTDYGYHIIKVTDKATTYKAVRDDVKATLLSNDFSEEINSLVEKADIKENEKLLKSISYK